MASSNEADIYNRLQLFREEDLDRPRRQDPATSRVKRCLFGRGNHEENIKFAKREIEKSLLESKKKWNFDFENEQPMSGRFDWQPSPYPRPAVLLRRSSTATAESGATASENAENLNPVSSSSSSSDLVDLQQNTSSSKHTSSTSSTSDEPSLTICDRGQSSSSSSDQGPSNSMANQRSASPKRQASINRIYRQRKRSKSKVKVQERKIDDSSEDTLSSPQPQQAAAASSRSRSGESD